MKLKIKNGYFSHKTSISTLVEDPKIEKPVSKW